MIFLLLVTAVQAYNLVVDVNPKAVTTYLENFGSFYRQQLTDHEIPVIEKNRCLGKIAIASTTVSQVEIERTEAIRENGDYYLKLTHLHARLHGDYKHNVLFVHQSGDFDLRIRDLNATLGPLVPVAIAGLPYIDSSVGCRISHSEDNFDVHGGILRVIAKRRLRETLETDLEALLCDSLISILDKGIRISLEHVQLKSRLHDDELISFALSRPPLMLESGAIRVFHEGVSSHSVNKNFRFDVEAVENLNFDVVFHIHQNLLTEALSSVCKHFERNVSNTTVNCLNVSANFFELEKNDNVILTTTLEEEGVQKTREYNSRLLHSEKLVLYIRLKSERLASGRRGDEFGRTLFTTFSEILRSKFLLALPLPKNLRMENLQAQFGSDRLVLVGNLK